MFFSSFTAHAATVEFCELICVAQFAPGRKSKQALLFAAFFSLISRRPTRHLRWRTSAREEERLALVVSGSALYGSFSCSLRRASALLSGQLAATCLRWSLFAESAPCFTLHFKTLAARCDGRSARWKQAGRRALTSARLQPAALQVSSRKSSKTLIKL